MDAAPPAELVERFADDLDRLIAPTASVGLAVSGGPDSLALLLLAAAARPHRVQAATVDHGLREESRDEADAVAGLCRTLGVPHRVLAPSWDRERKTAIQERARDARYEQLGQWVKAQQLAALATGHHRDDQAETVLMRLARGAGTRGLAGMRAVATVPGHGDVPLLRPLLGWRASELGAICAAAGVSPAADPGNRDAQFERVRARQLLARQEVIAPEPLARTAAALGDADDALEWATDRTWQSVATTGETGFVVDAATLPAEIQRRLVGRAVLAVATENADAHLRGREIDRVLEALRSGRQTTLRGVLCSGGDQWTFIPAPNRTRRGSPLR